MDGMVGENCFNFQPWMKIAVIVTIAVKPKNIISVHRVAIIAVCHSVKFFSTQKKKNNKIKSEKISKKIILLENATK